MTKKCGIYKITIRDKVYIGQSVGIIERWQTHRYTLRKGIHRNTHLQGLYNKYPNEMKFEVLEECIRDKEVLTQREQYWMDQYISCRVNFGVAAQSPRLGSKSTPEHIEKIRQSNLGKKRSPEVCKNISNSHKGQVVSEEHKEKLSKANKKPWSDSRHKAQEEWRKNYKPIESKVCRVCEIEKTLVDFSSNKNGKGKVSTECKSCESRRKKKYHQDKKTIEA